MAETTRERRTRLRASGLCINCASAPSVWSGLCEVCKAAAKVAAAKYAAKEKVKKALLKKGQYAAKEKVAQSGPVREFEVTIKIRNNLLKQRREEMGVSQTEFAKMVGLSMDAINRLECLRASPLSTDGEQWLPTALKLANFHALSPEELWPDVVLAVKQSTVVRRVDGDGLLALATEYQERSALGPGHEYDLQELREQVVGALEGLNSRERNILRDRYGFDGNDDMTLDEIGAKWGISKERVRQIERKALVRLRCRGVALQSWAPEGVVKPQEDENE